MPIYCMTLNIKMVSVIDKRNMLYLIRHGQSLFNLEADEQLREKMAGNFSKKSKQYLSMKFDQKYIDCGLTQKGKQQCLKAREYMKEKHIDMVIVSPMRRTLMTCDIIFNGHKSNPKIIVNPEIRSVYSSSCDIGGRLYQSMQELKHFDFSSIKNPSYWYLQSIFDKQIRDQLIGKIIHLEHQKQRHDEAKKMFLNYLIENAESIGPQTFANFNHQKEIIRQISKEYGSVAVVSHSQNILAYTGKQIKNCDIVELQITDF